MGAVRWRVDAPRCPIAIAFRRCCPIVFGCRICDSFGLQVCRECDTVFPVGARLDSAVTSEELREKFSFEPEFNKDGTPMVRSHCGHLTPPPSPVPGFPHLGQVLGAPALEAACWRSLMDVLGRSGVKGGHHRWGV